MMTDSDRLDRVVELLEAIAKKLDARVPASRGPMTDEERRGWRELNSGVRRAARWDGEGPPPAGGTPPEEFFARKPGRSV